MATARGSAHDGSTPNQDAHAVREILTGKVPVVVAAVADGHGGRRYVRSGTGSELAVEAGLDVVEQRLRAWPEAASLDGLLSQSAPSVVDRWCEAVKAHVAAHPFTDTEAESAGAQLQDQPLVSYGSTLLLAVVRGDEVALAQLGDGDALVRTDGGAVRNPIPGDPRLVAGETTSLCLPGAGQDFRFAYLEARARCDLVLLATDGYGNSFASPDWRTRVVVDIADQVAGSGLATTSASLPGWLEESAAVGGDDVTVVVLVHAPDGGAQSTENVPASDSTPPQAPQREHSLASRPQGPPSERSGHGGRPWWVVAGVGLAVGVVALVGTVLVRYLQPDASGTAPTPHPSVHATSASPAPVRPTPTQQAPTRAPTPSATSSGLGGTNG